jgi:hypothetical protein
MAKSVGTSAGRIRPLLAAIAIVWPAHASAGDASPLPPADGAQTANDSAPQPRPRKLRSADFLGAIASHDARRVADWVVTSGDNGGLPFVIVDKIQAKVFVFDSAGRLRGSSFALLGTARGDRSIPGIGSRKLSTIRPEERTTPAGRFVASIGHDLKNDILWVDYKDSISLHRVIRGNPGDHRLQRLATASRLDKRITYGCINVPVKFYDTVVLGTFTGTSGVVYILPETETARDVFPKLAIDASDQR